MKKKGLLFSAAVCSICLLAACGEKPKEQDTTVAGSREESDITYVTVQATYEDIVLEKTLTCIYNASKFHDLSFGIPDYRIEEYSWERGQMVQKGQLLATLDLGDLEEQIPELEYTAKSSRLLLKQLKEQKEKDLEAAYILYTYGKMEKRDKDELKKKQEQIEKQYIDRIEELEDQVDVDDTRLRLAREKLEQGRIYAPFTGEITYVLDLHPVTYNRIQGAPAGLTGVQSKVGETILTISELSDCYFQCRNIEYMQCFAEGETYQIRCVNEGEIVYYNVTPVERDNWASEGIMKFALTDEGDYVNLSTAGSLVASVGEKNQVLCLPTKAIHKTEKGYFVYVLEDGMRKMKSVEIGLAGTGKTEILSGITQQDVVIVEQAISDEDAASNAGAATVSDSDTQAGTGQKEGDGDEK